MTFQKLTVTLAPGAPQQIKWQITFRLDHSVKAQMSYISGVGGDDGFLVRTAKNSEFIISVEGCSLKRCQLCLAKHQLKSHMPTVLSDFNIEKRFHQNFSQEEVEQLLLGIQNTEGLVSNGGN